MYQIEPKFLVINEKNDIDHRKFFQIIQQHNRTLLDSIPLLFVGFVSCTVRMRGENELCIVSVSVRLFRVKFVETIRGRTFSHFS